MPSSPPRVHTDRGPESALASRHRDMRATALRWHLGMSESRRGRPWAGRAPPGRPAERTGRAERKHPCWDGPLTGLGRGTGSTAVGPPRGLCHHGREAGAGPAAGGRCQCQGRAGRTRGGWGRRFLFEWKRGKRACPRSLLCVHTHDLCKLAAGGLAPRRRALASSSRGVCVLGPGHTLPLGRRSQGGAGRPRPGAGAERGVARVAGAFPATPRVGSAFLGWSPRGRLPES